MSSHCTASCLHLREVIHSQQHILICIEELTKRTRSTALCITTGVEIVEIYGTFPLLFQGVSLGDIAPLPRSINDGMNSPTHYNVNFSQALSHDVSLHEAMLLCSDNTFRRDPAARTSQPQEQILQLNSPTTDTEQILPGTNLTGFLPFVDNQMRNLSQDHLYDLDINILDETNLMSLATGFDPMEVSWLL